MKPTMTITSKHLTLILGILVALIVVVLMTLRSPEVNQALSQIFPSIEFPSATTQISELKFTFIRVAEMIR
jgi:hypothetical protein